MDSDLAPALLIAASFGLGGGLWLLARGLGGYRAATRIADTSTSTISSLAVGEVRVSGVVEPAELTLVSPLQSRTCVYYRARIREGDRGERRDVIDEERAVGFRVRDDSGSIRVFPRAAQWDVPARFDDRDDQFGSSPPGLALRDGPGVQPATPDRETLVAQLLTVRPGLGDADATPLARMIGRGRRDYEEARLEPGETVTVVGTALPFDQLPDPATADLADTAGALTVGGSLASMADPEIAADLAEARAAGILETDPAEAWGNAAISGFEFGRPVRPPELDPAANPVPLANEPTAERFERTFEIAPVELVLAAMPDHPLLVAFGAPGSAVARHEDRFLLGLLGAVLAIASAVVLALQVGGSLAP